MAITQRVLPRASATGLVPLLVVSQVVSLQCGAAVAKGLFSAVGPSVTVCFRLGFAAAVVGTVARPRPWRFSRRQLAAACNLGCVLAAMNLAYFHAIAVLPLGVAAALELLGPLGLAVVLAQRASEYACAVLAVVGTVTLVVASVGVDGAVGIGGEAGGSAATSVAGLTLGLGAAMLRAIYVLLSRQIGQLFDGWSGLAAGLGVGAALTVVVTLAAAATSRPEGAERLAATTAPGNLARGLVVALLCAVVPYGLDLVALRRASPHVFGVLLGAGPVIGAAVGYLALGERLTALQLVGIGCVAVAAVAVSLTAVSPTAVPPTTVAVTHGERRGGGMRRPPATATLSPVRRRAPRSGASP